MTEELNKSVEKAQRDGNIESKSRTESGRTITCYNRACPDYRVERDYDVDCRCKRTSVTASTVKF